MDFLAAAHRVNKVTEKKEFKVSVITVAIYVRGIKI
jgi:hypothetical protein